MVINKQIEYLQSLISDGIINISEGNNELYMLKEKAVMQIHNKAVCQRSDGRYVTKVGTGKPYLQKTASTYEELIEKLYDYYFGIQNSTLEGLYPKWIEYRKNETSVKEKTIKENQFLWNAHLKGQEITKKPIKVLTTKEYISFFRLITKTREMTRKRFNDMKSVLNGILYYAVEMDIISHNPLLDINYQQFSFKAENNEIMPYTEVERRRILEYLGNDDLYSLAIKLFFYLTIRIGELKGLRFNDIVNGYIHVQRFVNNKNEIENDIKGHASVGIRWLPLPQESLIVIDYIRKINPNSEFLFFHNGKPITTVTFNRRLKKCCNELGIVYRSSHKLRFSTASILYKNGVTIPELQEMLGHTTSTMTNHYLRNVTSKNETYDKVNYIFS